MNFDDIAARIFVCLGLMGFTALLGAFLVSMYALVRFLLEN